MTRSDEIAIFMHDGRVIRLYTDANKRREIADALSNRISSQSHGGAVSVIDGDREYIVNVAYVAFIETAR